LSFGKKSKYGVVTATRGMAMVHSAESIDCRRAGHAARGAQRTNMPVP
jgi:hypothetical protein